MRVFPLEGRREKRIIISYTQKLDTLYGQTNYRLLGGHSEQLVKEWSFRARVVGAAGQDWGSSHDLKTDEVGGDLVFTARAKALMPKEDLLLRVDEKDPAVEATDFARFSRALHEKHQYLMLRYRPVLEVAADADRQRRDWVILFESSGDRSPLDARVQIDVVREILANAEHQDRFWIIQAGTHVRKYAESPHYATADNIAAAVAYLEKAHLVGALDLEGALVAASKICAEAENPYIVHVGTGIPVLGERKTDVLVKGIPAGARYVGIGVGKRFNRTFMKEAAAQTGGFCTQINPDENVGWRSFELVSTLNTPRLQKIKVTSDPGNGEFLLFGDSLAEGEELCAVARFDKDKPRPVIITITGTLDGKPWSQEVAVDQVVEGADYLPRFWAKLEIDRLLTGDVKKNREPIIALSKAMYVMSPFTSLLVLENEAMYKEYKVDRGRKDHWALYPAPKKIKDVHEPDPRWTGRPVTDPKDPSKKPSAQQVLNTIMVRIPPRMLHWPNQQNYYGGQVLTAWQYFSGAYAVPVYLGGDWEDRRGGRVLRKGESLSAWSTDGISIEGKSAFNLTLYNGQMGWSLKGQRRLGVHDKNNALIRGDGKRAELATEAMGLFDWREEAAGGRGRWDGRRSRRRNLAGANWPTSMLEFRPFGNRGIPSSPTMVSRLPSGMPMPSAVGPRVRFNRPVSVPVAMDELTGFGDIPVLGSMPVLGRLFDADGEMADEDDGWGNYYAYGLNSRLRSGSGFPNVMYQRPRFSGDWRVFSDLLAYAPGMNTSYADILAVLAAEAKPHKAAAAGRIDPKAAALIARARKAGWRAVTIPDAKGKPVLTVTFDGAGRFAYQRTTRSGLTERVICDGKTLWHLYDELGVGAVRTVSRFHRQTLTAMAPWVLPEAEDLAHGVNVLSVDERTVALSPVGAEGAKDADGKPLTYARVHLVFAEGGRLAERRVVEMPSGKTLYRQTYADDGAVRWLDADDKELAKVKLTVLRAPEPNLEPDVSKLVVLPLPFRSRQHVYAARKITGGHENFKVADAMAVLSSDLGHANGWDALRLVGRRFFDKGDRRIGFYTILGTLHHNYNWQIGEINIGGNKKVRFAPADDHPGSALARYIEQHVRARRSGQRDKFTDPGDADGGFVEHLSRFSYLYHRWTTGQATRDSAKRKAEQDKALDFVRKSKASPFGWVMLSVLQNYYGGNREFYRALGEAGRQFEQVNGLTYAARYETARRLRHSGDHKGAAKLFEKLYTDTLGQGALPPIDSEFRAAFQSGGAEGTDRWLKLMRDTASGLVAKKARSAAVVLAWQCHQTGDGPLAEELLSVALSGVKPDARLGATLTAIEYLSATGQHARADAMVEPLLADKKLSAHPALWRLGATLASRRGRLASSLRRLERAMDIEYANLPDVIDLQGVRGSYGALLNQYLTLAQAIATLEKDPPVDFLVRVVRAADRWRSLDADGAAACQAAARVLQALGSRELAWEYLTTPLALKPNEAAPWTALAKSLKSQGEFDLADRAYASAFETERTNAQILWERAQLAQQLGRGAKAQELYRQIAEGTWPRQFNWIRSQARKYVGMR